MRARGAFFCALLIAVACASPEEKPAERSAVKPAEKPATRPTPAEKTATKAAAAKSQPARTTYASWQKVMADGVGPAFDYHVKEATKAPDAMDLPSVAKFAAEAADALVQGRARFGRPDNPEFMKFAAEAEAFFRELERAATKGDGAAAKKLVQSGEERHCNRCHDKYQF